MTRLATTLLASLLLVAPMGAFAQQTTTEEVVKPEVEAETATEAQAETEAAATEAPAAPVEMEDVTATAAPPSEVIKETIGAWSIVCAPDGSACIMAQKGSDAEGREVMEVRIRRLPEQTKNNVTIVGAIQIAVPIGVLLPPGVNLQIDGGKARPAVYRTCNPGACLVQEAIDTGLVNNMKKGAKAVFTIIAPPNSKIPVEISLSGFTAAYNSLKP